jgi:branched-subunit amino acid aminotransferase/4-amino-4-deoxychorismate lyase
MVYEMDEVFLTNAIRGIQAVGRLENKEYPKKTALSQIVSFGQKVL